MPANESAPGAGQIKQKRPRGRPRKHPLAAAANTAKVAKGRSKTGNVLTVEGEARNAFKDIILQLANRHQGLMHSILAVSSKHIDFGAPYGTKILQENPSTNEEALHQRGEYHHDEAMKRLYEDMAKPMDKDDPEYKTILAARYGQMLCLLLQTRAEGNPRGEHRVHLQAYRNLIQHNPPDDPTLHTFITEFFQYHIYADDLFWHPETMTKRLSSEEWEPTMPIFPPRLIGVADGLFKHLSQITSIKNRIRANMAASVDPAVDHSTLFRASEIDGAIREWTPSWPPGDSRGRLGLLYKQMTWVYLFRTIYPPTPAPARRSTIGSLPAAPLRRPSPEDQRITLAVDESLSILESFKPSDPAQTLLLIPCLILGTASSGPSQQQRIRAALKAVRGYTGLRNCDRVLELLEEVWRLMGQGDWAAVWDWQGVARRMDLNFSCA
ncbi:hypothetical protein ESCO_002751 [Escovopsis weberi]|uniref:Uncharacterized protein n=1 Tax=Escovopsis weberi TaxID=150374 RepID=A0A0M8N1B1_ESCWE|nr:hypothetical protein ESCO_002751 [Escovopsis weberi]